MEPNVEPVEEHTSKSLIFLGALLIFTLLLSFVPAKWFGITPKTTTQPKLDLAALVKLRNDTNNNSTPDWKDLAIETFGRASSTLVNIDSDPQAIKRLEDPNNLTSSFSKNLYVASAYLSQEGVTDQASQQKVLDALVAQEAGKITTKTYTQSDLVIGTSDSVQSHKIYGNRVAILLNNIITEKTIVDDLSGINTYLANKDASALLPLQKNGARIGTILMSLEKLSVPPSLVAIHLLALNRIASYKNTLDNLSLAASDPVRATIALEGYSEQAVLVLRLVGRYRDFFSTGSVVFSPQDAGYLFSPSYTKQ